jgi:hypothetical protein
MGVLPTNPAMHLQARRAEEERARAEAEEAARLEEEERLRAEERERKKAAAKAKKEELKRQGKLLTGGRQGWGGSRGWGCMHEAAKDLGVPGVHGAILDWVLHTIPTAAGAKSGATPAYSADAKHQHMYQPAPA